jgi:acetyl-CoA carboxylase biotin carboxylase subunit
VNAEDPSNNFMPFPGLVRRDDRARANARFDTMLYEGYAIPPFYDSLLGQADCVTVRTVTRPWMRWQRR